MKWIDSTHLNQWASRREAQGLLPHLIRRLILAYHEPQTLSFPAGDAVWIPGFDGILEITQTSLYAPAGKSVWECGCGQDPKSKANSDYKKRSENPLAAKREETTFIFVTPRIFSDKEQWAEEKKAEGLWNDVRAYDATDLECWIEDAPAVGAWIAKQLGIFTADITSADDIKEEWASISTPPINIAIVLAGREQERTPIVGWLNQDPATINVQAPTKREAVLFLLAVASQLSKDQADEFFSRCVVVSSPDAFRQIALSKRPLIIIPDFETNGSMFLKAVHSGHHVYIPLDPTNTVNNNRLTLSRLGRDGFVSCLKDSGFPDKMAEELNRETGRSLSALERKVAAASDQPPWAQLPKVHDLIPILLAGRWAESSQKDPDVLAQLAGADYSMVQRVSSDLAAQPDAPVCNIGGNWRLLSPIDAWFAAAPFITKEEMDRFRNTAINVLSQRDPFLDLEKDKRYMASFYGKEPPYSKLLREGLCQTLILIAVYGENSLKCVEASQAWVDGVVRELLHEASTDRWFSLAHIIRFLAEASPLAFMDALDHSLQSESKDVMSLFKDEGDLFTSSCHHADTLWALEMMAWEPEYLGRAALLLAKLATWDEGSRYTNRPANSLRDIFLLWKPQTSASFDQQVEVLKLLVSNQPQIGWNLLLKLLPDHHSSTSPTHRPRWRELNTQEPIVTRFDYFKHSVSIFDILLTHVGVDGTRWAELLDEALTLPTEYGRAIDQLEDCLDNVQTGKNDLWEKLRRILHHHRTYKDADWSISEALLKRLDSLYSKLTPSGLYESNFWLFTSCGPEFPDGKFYGDYEANEKRANEARVSALNSIMDEGGIAAVIEFSQNVDAPRYAGHALSSITLTPEDEDKLFGLLLSDNLAIRELPENYVWHKAQASPDWVDGQYRLIEAKEWSAEKIAHFFLSLPQKLPTWNSLATFGEEAENIYWKIFNDRIHPRDVDAYSYAITKLLEAKRPVVALNLVWMGAEELSTKQITDILLALLENPPSEEERGQINSHEVTELFKTLSTCSDIEKDLYLQLEWAYLPILSSVGSQCGPVALCREMASNPSFFSEVLSYVYRPEDYAAAEPPSPDEKKKMLAEHGHDLLRSWNIVPGHTPNGDSIDFDKLLEWTTAARSLCKENGRLKVCDIHIGHVLAKAPQDKAAVTWPPEYVCKLIDVIESDKIEHGFEIQVHNNRGVTTRGFCEGGGQERSLAEKYRRWAHQIASQFPRTAKCLNVIATSYEHQAQRVDKEAEWQSLEY